MSSFQNAARVSHADRPASRLRPVVPHAVLLAVTLGTLALRAPPAAAALESTASDAAHIEASPLVTAHARTGAEAVPLGSAERTSLLVRAADDRAGVRRAVRAGSREDRVAKDVMKDADGTVHIRYTRTHQGRPVEGSGDLIVHDGPHGRQIDDSPHDPISVPAVKGTV